MPAINKNIVITPNKGHATNSPNVVFTGADNIATTLNVSDAGALQFVQGSGLAATSVKSAVTKAAGAADVNVFSVRDSADTPLFEVMQNGDTVIAGVLTVNGTGESTFAGDVVIGGSLTVEESATVTALMSGSDLTLTGNLIVNGNTDLGDAATDTVSIVGGIDTAVLPLTTDTYNLGSALKRWDNIYVKNVVAESSTLGGGGGSTSVAGDLIPSEDHTFDLGTASKRFDQGFISTVNANDIKIVSDGLFDMIGAATTKVFSIVDANETTPVELFSVRQNGDTVIGGVLTVNGTGKSTFAGDVEIGGSLTVEGDATVTALMSGTDLTLTGNLLVKGNTDLGDAATDTISIVGGVDSNVIPAADATYNLGSVAKKWNDVYVGGTLYSDDITATTVTIAGNLTVTGTTTYLNTETINLADNVLVLNSNLAADAAPTVNAGFEVNRGSANVEGHGVTLLWDEGRDLWTVGAQTFEAGTFSGTFSGGFDATTVTNMDARYVNVDGDSMTGDLTITGVLSATSKSFVINHPTKPGYKLRYGSLEGPENGVYVRATVKGSTEFTLPDYWVGLVDESTITVNLTANGKFQPLYTVSKSATKIVVGADGLAVSDLDFDIVVFAERKDVDKMTVEYQEVA